MEKTPKTKVCSKCGERKRASEFYSDKRTTTGLKSECKACHTKAGIRWQKKNPIAARNASRAYYQRDPSKRVNAVAKSRKKYGRAKEIKSVAERMPDHFVANRLELALKDAPPALIEAKRIQLQIKRYLKNGN